jgi:hypothetical protein
MVAMTIKTVIIKCTYRTAENLRGAHNLIERDFMVELQIDEDGTVDSWAVDDRTACFYTDLAKYDAAEILFEGSEIEGQTGSLHIDYVSECFTQKSELNGEWLELNSNFDLVGSSTTRRCGSATPLRLRKRARGALYRRTR